MRQHPLDLLPVTMHAQTQARVTASRNIGLAVIALGLVIATATHGRFLRDRAESRLQALRIQARQLDENEARAAEMQVEIDHFNRLFDRYQAVETPLEVTRLLASVIEEMPASATIDRIDVSTEQSHRARSGSKKEKEVPPRAFVAEISGFARDDLDIAEFVSNLDKRAPFSDVSLDFSRQRLVNDRSAREFRLSLTVDFEVAYEVVEAEEPHNRRSANAE